MTTYVMRVLTLRDRDNLGEFVNETFQAENDLEAILFVAEDFATQGKELYIQGDEEEYFESLRELYKQDEQQAIEKAKKLLITEDYTDYYDNVAFITCEDHVVYEDDVVMDMEDECDDYDDEVDDMED